MPMSLAVRVSADGGSEWLVPKEYWVGLWARELVLHVRPVPRGGGFVSQENSSLSLVQLTGKTMTCSGHIPWGIVKVPHCKSIGVDPN